LFPHENTTPFELNARECYPPQAIFIILFAGKPGPEEKRGIFLGFFTYSTSSPKPKIQLIIHKLNKKLATKSWFKNFWL